MAKPRQAIIALGSNLGDRQGRLARAVKLLRRSQGIQTLITSPVYETAPVGLEKQPSFLNMVAGIETLLSAEELMRLLLEIERKMGRVRLERWGPRIIDLDLLFYEDETRRAPGLILPHPRWSERSFVMIPLRDLLEHPEFQRPVWKNLQWRLRDLPPDEKVRRISED